MSGRRAGCPGLVDVRRLVGCCGRSLQRLDVRAWGRMSGSRSFLLLLSAFPFIRELGDLYIFMCIFGEGPLGT